MSYPARAGKHVTFILYSNGSTMFSFSTKYPNEGPKRHPPRRKENQKQANGKINYFKKYSIHIAIIGYLEPLP